MGKKAKFGKNRKDKFYHLAKETGYRARSAFKLIQLNRKFGFLPKSRVLIDLCAAPGGWLQVAQKFMPVSSIIIGVDLVPIRPIRNVTTFVSDITTETCRQMIRKELQSWKADCVLHDGAPNVGSAWIQDAFSQAQLTLSSLKLATDFLNKGGCFVTKVFRSKDYAALLVVFEKLFKSVQATKPQASRNESAEIFVVCRGYRAPSKMDPALLDPKSVFKEPEEESKLRLNILHPEKRTRQREGYPENNISLFTATNVSEFIETGNPIEILSTSNQLKFDDEKYKNSEATTNEVLVCCEDIKVLGKRELRLLFNWRKKLRIALGLVKTAKAKDADEEGKESEDETSEEKVASMIEEAKKDETAAAKRQRRRDQERKQKLGLKMRQDQTATSDTIENTETDLFRLDIIKSRKALDTVDDLKMDADAEEFLNDSEEELEFESDGEDADSDASSNYDYHDNEDQYGAKKGSNKRKLEAAEVHEIVKMKKKSEKAKPSDNPLLVGYEEKHESAGSAANLWYKKEIFNEAEDSDEDEDYDIEQMMKSARQDGVQIQADSKSQGKVSKESNRTPGGDQDDDDDDSDEDDDDGKYDVDDRSVSIGRKEEAKEKVKKNASSFEIAPLQTQVQHLSATGLAIGTAMVTSKKRRRDIIDDSFNRYSIGAESVPKWFLEEETQHRVRQVPVTREEIHAYKERMREINARPIKKVIEARAKKKYKLAKKLERVRSKAASISDTVDVSDKEKLDQIKGIYKKAGLLSKKKAEKTYVVAKKSQAGKRYQRPANVKGQYKVVDPRMKKETRATKRKEKSTARKRRKK